MIVSDDDFLARIEAFIRDSDISATAFGKRVAGDPNLVFDLRNGRSPSLRIAQQALRFIEAESLVNGAETRPSSGDAA